MDETPPTLVVDVGGTLATRDRPGPFQRALTAVERRREVSPGLRDALARAVLTGADHDGAATRLAELAPDAAHEAAAAVARPEGEPALLPGARELLGRAHEHGWRLVVATNAAAWMDDPLGDLAPLVSAVVSSAGVGLLKSDDGFWAALREQVAPDPRRTIVVGDSWADDVAAPTRAGFLTVPVTSSTSVGDLAAAVAAAGPPPEGTVAVVGGSPVRWGGRPVLVCPHLHDLVGRRTRWRGRACVDGSGRGLPVEVVRRRDAAPAVVGTHPLPALAWLVATPDRRTVVPPSDMRTALAAAGVDLDGLPLHDQRHLVSMVREAKVEHIRRSRIDDVISLLRDGGSS